MSVEEIVVKIKVIVDVVDVYGNPLFPEPQMSTMDGDGDGEDDTGHGTPPNP